MAESTATRSDLAKRQSRDQLAHFVAPPDMRGRPCPHACCRNRHPHPGRIPVKLDRSYLRSLTDQEVERELLTYQRYSDSHESGFLQVLAEAQRREDAPRIAAERKEKARERRARTGSQFRDEVYREWLHAENATNGYFLSKAGKRAGIDERMLFTTSSQSKVDKYASDELKEYFLSHPRPTRARILGKGADRRDRMQAAVFGADAGHW